MSSTSLSPRKVIVTAYRIGQSALPTYAHRFSPKKFTQPQLFACLAIKTFFKQDYRRTEAMLRDWPALCKAIGMKTVPDHSTLHKAAKRLLRCQPSDAMLSATVRLMMGRRKRVKLAAMDSTGLESGQISPYYVKRRSRDKSLENVWQTTTYTCFPKLGVVCDCATHLILGVLTGRGPKPDVSQFRATLDQALRRVKLQWLVADAGYDSEANHVYARDGCAIRTIIPARIGRPTNKPPTGRYRRLMTQRFNKTRYGQRWQVETVFSMIKRQLGDALRARRYWSQCREMMLLVLTHNIMLILWLTRFSTEQVGSL